MSFNPTNEQYDAIHKNGSILVSAAAGSGKTAVLVERVCNLLCDSKNGISADKILVVTFTNAAAEELRLRIEKRLFEEFEKHPSDMYLQKQRILLNNAKICTIDSFCIDFLRENFENTGLGPSFKIADKATTINLERQALSFVINECFENGDANFLGLLNFLGDTYDDAKIQKAIMRIFKFSRNIPFPNNWLSTIVCKFDNHACNKDNFWFDEAISFAEEIAEEAFSNISRALEYLEENPVAYEKYRDCFCYIYSFCENVLRLCNEKNWDEAYEYLQSKDIPACKRLSAKDKTQCVDAAKIFRDSAKENIGKLEKIIYANKSNISAEFIFVYPHIKKLVELTKTFSDKYYSLLRERDMITFYIAEQTVLSLLAEVNGSGEIIPSESSKEYINRYDAILVDEYQDTNSLQDMLFYILSDRSSKLFCVGDVKQSIYKFRGANPSNFLIKKKNSFINDECGSKLGTLRIDLGCNFRSRLEICEFINSIFSKLIYEKNSDFNYDDREKLISKANYPENPDSKFEAHFVDYQKIFAEKHYEDKIFAEAEIVADIVNNTVNKEPFLRCGDSLRKATYGDITILVRSMKDKGDVFVKVLKEYGIPVSVSALDVLDSDEVITLLSFLKILNNPSDDISLLTVLTSPVYAFTLQELAEIRSVHKYGSFISALAASRKLYNKVDKFLNSLESLRRKSVLLSIDLLIEEIFEVTNILNIYSASENGDVKRLNLLSVQNIGSSVEGEYKRNLRSFISYISELENKDFSLSSSKSDCVTVMSIHKSKGLQFPVCIVANLSNQFNEQDLKDSILVNEKFGIGLTYYDDSEIKYDKTLLRSLIKAEEQKQLLAEELRIFYVALTRAEEKLILVSTFDNIPNAVDDKKKLLDSSDSKDKIEYAVFKSNKSYSDWIMETLLLDGYADAILEKSTNKHIFVHNRVPEFKLLENSHVCVTEDINKVELLKQGYDYVYPFNELLSLESKASVTDLVHKADDTKYRFTKRPSFMQEKGVSSAEKGTAIHKVMQYANFDVCKNDLQTEIDRLYDFMFLTHEEYNVIDKDVIKRFFSSNIFNRIENSTFVKREMKFLVEFSATELNLELDSKFNDEMIVVQGAVDLIFEEEDSIVILDFKTDRNKDECELLSAYGEQLRIYSKACSKILNKPVKELLLYSFSLGKEIPVI